VPPYSTVVASRYLDVDPSIELDPMLGPGQGLAYWQRWSELLTGGRWDPTASIGDEDRARRLGNYAIAVNLAFELGHHLIDEYRQPLDRTFAEYDYVAAQLGVAMLDELAEPRFDTLRSSYLAIIEELLGQASPELVSDLPADADAFRIHIFGIPGDGLNTPASLPGGTEGVALRLAIFRHVLGAPPAFGELASRLRAALATHLSGRRLAPFDATVETIRALPEHLGGLRMAIDADGRVRGARVIAPLTLEVVDERGERVEVHLPGDGEVELTGFQVDADGWRAALRRKPPGQPELARISITGGVIAVTVDPVELEAGTIIDVVGDNAAGDRPRADIYWDTWPSAYLRDGPDGLSEVASFGWSDAVSGGPYRDGTGDDAIVWAYRGTAHLGTDLVFADSAGSLRHLGPDNQVTTIIGGGLRGWRDGSIERAAVIEPARPAALADGRIAFIDHRPMVRDGEAVRVPHLRAIRVRGGRER
jgi:hypothetical protein